MQKFLQFNDHTSYVLCISALKLIRELQQTFYKFCLKVLGFIYNLICMFDKHCTQYNWYRICNNGMRTYLVEDDEISLKND